MAEWEYFSTTESERLNSLGMEGWELAGVAPSSQGGETTFYLKRPAHDFRERVTNDQKRHYYEKLGIKSADSERGE